MTRLQEQLSFRISAEERARLENLASAEQRSVAFIARRALARALDGAPEPVVARETDRSAVAS